MNSEITTKRSPIVLIWKFAIVEAIGAFLYFIATLLGNTKYELYSQVSFSNFLSYQTAKMLFLSGALFALTVYAFLSWYYESYVFRPGSLTHERGVFFKKKKTFQMDESASMTISSGALGKLLHYGSVRVENGGKSFVLNSISRPEKFIDAVRGLYGPDRNFFFEEPDPVRLLKQDEHEGLEFKSSLRFDYKIGHVNRELEKAAMKTVAAFLNSKGGYLIVGVSDARTPLGLSSDYQTLQRKDSDGFENHFTQSFNSMIGPEFRHLTKLWFHKIDGHDICTVQALPSPRPIYLKMDNNEHFYMRTGNISTGLKLSEIESYSRSRWPKKVSV
ncbi:MAG: RNA-binding domain-containing protein [Patescibacteria group bacterium]